MKYEPDTLLELPVEPSHDPGVVLEAMHRGGGMAAAWRACTGGVRAAHSWRRIDSASYGALPLGSVHEWDDILRAVIVYKWQLYVRGPGGQMPAVNDQPPTFVYECRKDGCENQGVQITYQAKFVDDNTDLGYFHRPEIVCRCGIEPRVVRIQGWSR